MIWEHKTDYVVTRSSMTEEQAKTFATDAILLMTTTRHGMCEMR